MLRISDQKNVNKSKNRLTPAKLDNKKQGKKHLPSGWVRARTSPTSVEEEPLMGKVDSPTPAKLESKKQDKKLLASREGSGGKLLSNVRKKPRSI